ncbi:MAG: NADH dehydrogenase FAD-containing subunit [Candidatus Anammoximicrobium sp.]|nr:NADH dehydrogenase FAD-containing subunit [Candidatus Anammoximicrobium sp.]
MSVLLALILTPALAGCAAFASSPRGARRAILLLAGAAHLALTVRLWWARPAVSPQSWLGVDAMGLVFLTIASVLFLAAAVYSLGYLRDEQRSRHVDIEEGFLFINEPEAVFIGCLLLFLASMTLVTLSRHFGLLWVGVEATTLATAPLIYFHRHHRSLEATWKYLLICSVGIALALLGNFLLAVAAAGVRSGQAALLVDSLRQQAAQLNGPWLKVAFVFFLVGYGTKMGLAPLHTWLPDAHSESPSPVSALLSGALLNCAFLGILRMHQLCVAAGQADFSQGLLILFGLASVLVAAAFLQRQADFKRLLAYSSVEHMGLLALGVGLGGVGVFGSLLHAVNHSLTKAAMFLVAGNILAAYATKSTADVRGIRRVLPVTGVLWLAGFLALTGSPPFGTFLSEFTILKAALDQHHYVVAVLYLALLGLIFIGMANLVLPMAQGEALGKGPPAPRRRGEPLWSVVPAAVLLALTLTLGLWIPTWFRGALDEAASGFRTAAAPATAVATAEELLPR